VLWERVFSTQNLAIDSDNNNGYAMPDFSSVENDQEYAINNPEKPGKIIVVGIRDSDSDGIPDFADFDAAALSNFTPMGLTYRLGNPADFKSTVLIFNYAASDPSKVKVFGDEAIGYQYIPAPGLLRIWKKPADQARNFKSVTAGGDWLPANVPIPASLLPLDGDNRVTLYIETLGLSQQTGDHLVQLKVSYL
jgi:hypothetical protein